MCAGLKGCRVWPPPPPNTPRPTPQRKCWCLQEMQDKAGRWVEGAWKMCLGLAGGAEGGALLRTPRTRLFVVAEGKGPTSRAALPPFIHYPSFPLYSSPFRDLRSHRAAPPPLPRAISASSYADCWPLAPWEPEFLNSPPSVWDLEGTHQEAPAAAASGAGVRSSRSRRPPSCSARNDRGASRARSRRGGGEWGG